MTARFTIRALIPGCDLKPTPIARLFFAAGWDSTNLFIWGGVDSRFRHWEWEAL